MHGLHDRCEAGGARRIFMVVETDSQLMWKLKKQGFMLYAGSSVVSMIMGIVYSGFGVGAVIIPIAFIVMYYLNVKHMS